MALELQNAVSTLVIDYLRADVGKTPDWLKRPGRAECGEHWPLICELYRSLTDGAELPDSMPPRERRTIDAVLIVGDTRRILEVDETQHFNRFRAATLERYPQDLAVAFPIEDWLAACARKTRLEAGGFAKPRPPLFPDPGGRHQQRAFRDALADILPSSHGWEPTLRIADFEVKGWVFQPGASERMTALLEHRLSG